MIIFQSTLLQEERHFQRYMQKTLERFQSTLLQEERQSHSSIPIPFILLSIHAPTRGATVVHFYHFHYLTLSIHAPTRGATLQNLALMFEDTYLSIHAPTRGATKDTASLDKLLATFNPRSYKRSDTQEVTLSEFNNAFNPRSYKRSDGGGSIVLLIIKSFNPRSYKRSDIFYVIFFIKFKLSIHAPTRGATRADYII